MTKHESRETQQHDQGAPLDQFVQHFQTEMLNLSPGQRLLAFRRILQLQDELCSQSESNPEPLKGFSLWEQYNIRLKVEAKMAIQPQVLVLQEALTALGGTSVSEKQAERFTFELRELLDQMNVRIRCMAENCDQPSYLSYKKRGSLPGKRFGCEHSPAQTQRYHGPTSLVIPYGMQLIDSPARPNRKLPE